MTWPRHEVSQASKASTHSGCRGFRRTTAASPARKGRIANTSPVSLGPINYTIIYDVYRICIYTKLILNKTNNIMLVTC